MITFFKGGSEHESSLSLKSEVAQVMVPPDPSVSYHWPVAPRRMQERKARLKKDLHKFKSQYMSYL